jgi:hypothetical protein
MLKIKPFFWRISTGTAILLAGCVLAVRANVPRGWHLVGSNPTEFEAGVDAGQTYQSRASAFLKSKQSSVEGFGTLMQTIQAEQYKGKKVRLSGLVKSQDVAEWAGLWMRVDQGKDVVAMDNMQDRAIKGKGRDGNIIWDFTGRWWRGLAKQHEIRCSRGRRSGNDGSRQTCQFGIY